jgi:predicted cupin superfamily sugar epimerase
MRTLIEKYNLIPHPEGGYYREIYRSSNQVRLPDGRTRKAMTAIHFLLGRNDVSHWHRVKSDELWHFCAGDALELHEIHADLKTHAVHRLGSDTGSFFVVIRAGHWQAARTTGGYSLASCVVGPGFEFEDFQLLPDASDAQKAVLDKFPAAGLFQK